MTHGPAHAEKICGRFIGVRFLTKLTVGWAGEDDA